MHHLHLDFVRKPLPVWLGISLLVVGLSVSVLSYQQYEAASERNATLESELAQLQLGAKKSSSQIRLSSASSPELEKEMLRAQQRADFLMLPWNDLFSSLEFAATDDIALLAIEPDFKTHQVRLTAEAKNTDILFKYLKRLDKAPQLQGAHLVRHEIREEDKQHPVRFTVVAFWKAVS